MSEQERKYKLVNGEIVIPPMTYEEQLAWIALNGEGQLTVEEVDRIITQGTNVSLMPKSLIAETMVKIIAAYDLEAMAARKRNMRISALLKP